MTITSFWFLLFFAAVVCVYYLVPPSAQWMVLLAASIVFYLTAGAPYLLLYPIAASLVAYAAAVSVDRQAAKNDARGKRASLIAGVVILLTILIAVKYVRLTGYLQILVPAGLSFYIITLTGYVADVYTGIAEAFRNPLKVMLLGMYFPLMTSGPILQIKEDAAQFFVPHPLSYRNLTFGTQRMLWGFFQKLVISERLAVIVKTAYDDPETYGGAYVWLATVCFAFRLYTDFNGCMDIVIGTSECLSLTMPENFRIPFLAKNISDYWRRWHITLGAWMRMHFFYPLLRTKAVTRLNTALRAGLGKKKGKQVSNFIVLFFLWLVIGLWHGGEMKYVIGSGLLHWAYIVCGEVTLPFWIRLTDALHIKREGRGADAFRVVRTFFFVCTGFVFFRADSVPHALHLMKRAVTVWNPGSVFGAGITDLGLDAVDLSVTAIALFLFIAVNVYRLQKGELARADAVTYDETHIVRRHIAAWALPLRWFIWMGLLFAVILLGRYGPDFSAAEFIYRGF